LNLKEYIKQYIRELLDEESTSGDAGAYSTPFAFAKKGQKKNKATSTSEREGMKLAPEGTPSDSKVLDYKNLTGQKKKKYKLYKESDYDKASPYTATSDYGKASGYTSVGKDNHPNEYYGEKTESMNKLMNIIKEELLNEVSYSKFKSEVRNRTKSDQLNKAIREVKRKIQEIDRIVEYTSRMKQELSEGEDGIKYWKSTEKNIGAISEMVNNLNEKIKKLHE